MPHYKYEIRQSNGALSTGMVEAVNLSAAGSMLRAAGHYVMTLSPVATGGATNLAQKIATLSIQFGPGLRDVQAFTNQLSIMIKAGINIRSAIEGIGEQVENPKFRAMIQQIKLDVEAGKPFSDALARYPKTFGSLYVNMVRASEMSGNFGEMLERVGEYQTQQMETRSMVRGAMIYPCVIGFMAISVTIFLLTFVLPKFVSLFSGKEHMLPKPTKALLAMSHFMRVYWYICIAGAAASIWGFLYLIRTEGGKVWWDATKLRIPIFKKMFRALYITRSLHTMGELVNAGVPMLETISITADVSGNILYSNMWRSVYRAVKQGKKISYPLSREKLLPRNVIQMISAGEESGQLAQVLRDVSVHYSKELRNIIKAVTALIEPLMIIIMGFIVGFIAMSVILPIFKLSSLVK